MLLLLVPRLSSGFTAVGSSVRQVIEGSPVYSVRRGVSVREDTYPEPSVCEVGWVVPLRHLCLPVLQPDTDSLLGEQ